MGTDSPAARALLVRTRTLHLQTGNLLKCDRPRISMISKEGLHSSEDTSRHYNIFSTINPFDVGGFLALENGGGLSIDDKLPVLSLDYVIELPMGGLILEQISVFLTFK